MSYQSRLEALESAIAPQERLVVLIVQDGTTNQAALAAYAKAHGIAVTDVCVPVVYISGSDARLQMHLETRLARLEARYAVTDREPIRIVRLIVEPTGDITEAIVRASDGTLRRFVRLPAETREELSVRALSAA